MITDEEKDTDIEKDEEGFLELEAKVPAQSDNKDLWLFLIIVDVIFLCVFGLFSYKNIAAYLLSPQTSGKPEAVLLAQDTLPVEEVDAVLVAEPVPAPEAVAAVAKEEPAKETAPTQEPAAEQAVPVQPAEEPSVPAAVPQDPVQPQPASETETAAEKKQSVFVQSNPKSKYRQVSFRYYGAGDEVAVVSGFTMAKPRAMKKQNGYWETTLSISPGTYKYLFVVDGKQIVDPYGETKDGRSVLVLE